MRRGLGVGRRLVRSASLAIAGLGLMALVAWSGIYNVGASRGHWPITEWILRFVMENSVEAHAPDPRMPRLDDPDLVTLGAAHFLSGCAWCHGAPGVPAGTVAQRMLPPPPDLAGRTDRWTDQELFWIVKHGIKYTGMPSWPTQERDDEIWTLVAFLRALPSIDAARFRSLAWGGAPDDPKDGADMARFGGEAGSIDACARCHGADDRAPASALVPRLQGQPAGMLLQALRDYAGGERQSGIMQPIAAALAERAAVEVASYYAGLAPLPADDALPSASGRTLGSAGDAAGGIPACESCHKRDALPIYPRLAGQGAAYIAARLRAMQQAPRARTATQEIMLPIARRLTDRQIVDLAAYFAGLAP